MAATYSPSVMQVPSAMGDLTSLFGMGRGEHPRQNHHKAIRRIVFGIRVLDRKSLYSVPSTTIYNKVTYWKSCNNKVKKN